MLLMLHFIMVVMFDCRCVWCLCSGPCFIGCFSTALLILNLLSLLCHSTITFVLPNFTGLSLKYCLFLELYKLLDLIVYLFDEH